MEWTDLVPVLTCIFALIIGCYVYIVKTSRSTQDRQELFEREQRHKLANCQATRAGLADNRAERTDEKMTDLAKVITDFQLSMERRLTAIETTLKLNGGSRDRTKN